VNSSRPKVVVVGGGITGLSCARELCRDGQFDVTVLEAGSRLGGNIATERVDDYVIDSGPDAWVANKPDATNLARELGLEEELASTIPDNRRVYIAWQGRLHAMPEGLVLGIPTELGPLVQTPLLSVEGKLRAGMDLLIPARRFEDADDESVGAFVTRRLGEEVADRLVGPLLGGIFAGDAYAISIRAAFPQLVDAEAKHGSLIRAMRASRAAGGPRTRPAPSAFVSLRRGMGSLIDALGADVRRLADVRTSVRVRRIARRDGHYVVQFENGEPLIADQVVLALPTRASAPMVADMDAALSTSLAGLLGYASSIATFLAFPRSDVNHPLDATGFIVPRAPDRSLMAATFVSSKWEGRAPGEMALFRVFLGGEKVDALLERDDAELLALAQSELSEYVPVSSRPVMTRVVRHRLASPQPTVGHLVRRTKLRALLANCPGLHVAASGVEGVGIPDCIRQARAVADAIRSSAL
jgi:oxygen-dependent protoporphyrinogen oxidase